MKSALLKVMFAGIVLALASLACNAVAPGGSNVPSDTPVPTAIVPSNGNSGNGGGNVQPTQPPSDQPVFSDNFEGRNTNWGTGTDSDSSVEYVNGALQFIVITPKYFVYSQPNETMYENVHIEVTAKNDSTDSNAAFGIMCNQQVTDSAYYAYITPSGSYGIAMSAVAQDDTTLAAGTSDLIAKDAESYRLGLDCGNGTLTLYVDGQKIDSASDSNYTRGYVALFAWNDKVASGTNVTFDDFSMTSLP